MSSSTRQFVVCVASTCSCRSNIDEAINIIRNILTDDHRVRDEPPVWVKVVELNSSSVDLRARAWVSNTDWWDLRCDTLQKVKQAFDKAGITIPYPHQVTVTKGDPHVKAPEPAAPREPQPKAAE